MQRELSYCLSVADSLMLVSAMSLITPLGLLYLMGRLTEGLMWCPC
jgi:hypothetical protein